MVGVKSHGAKFRHKETSCSLRFIKLAMLSAHDGSGIVGFLVDVCVIGRTGQLRHFGPGPYSTVAGTPTCGSRNIFNRLRLRLRQLDRLSFGMVCVRDLRESRQSLTAQITILRKR
jgi:hypothetical protein